MITIQDCEAFCDADPGWVNELACRECLTMVEAYARTHEATLCANDLRMTAPASHTASATVPACNLRDT